MKLCTTVSPATMKTTPTTAWILAGKKKSMTFSLARCPFSDVLSVPGTAGSGLRRQGGTSASTRGWSFLHPRAEDSRPARTYAGYRDRREPREQHAGGAQDGPDPARHRLDRGHDRRRRPRDHRNGQPARASPGVHGLPRRCPVLRRHLSVRDGGLAVPPARRAIAAAADPDGGDPRRGTAGGRAGRTAAAGPRGARRARPLAVRSGRAARGRPAARAVRPGGRAAGGDHRPRTPAGPQTRSARPCGGSRTARPPSIPRCRCT